MGAYVSHGMGFLKLIAAYIAALKQTLAAPKRWYRAAKYRQDPLPDGAGRVARAGQQFDLVGITLTIGIASVVGYVVLFVNSRTEDAAGFDSSQDAVNRSAFENGSASLNGALDTAFSMYEVVFIAILLAVIVGALLMVRQRR